MINTEEREILNKIQRAGSLNSAEIAEQLHEDLAKVLKTVYALYSKKYIETKNHHWVRTEREVISCQHMKSQY